jgi:CheY-like chemotaxis protein
MKLFGKKIMIIDDDSVDRFILRKVLEKITSAEIIEFNSGVEALEKITGIAESRQKFPELIFLDVNMPVLDGFGFLDALEQLSGSYKTHYHIIFISSNKNEKEKKKVFNYSNVIGYFEKPITEEALLAFKKQLYKKAS